MSESRPGDGHGVGRSLFITATLDDRESQEKRRCKLNVIFVNKFAQVHVCLHMEHVCLHMWHVLVNTLGCVCLHM